jgi:hypothetical protein
VSRPSPVAELERLRDSLAELRKTLRHRLTSATSRVTAADLKEMARNIAERWLTELGAHPDVISNVSSEYLSDLGIHFERLLTASERATLRSKYESEIKAILSGYSITLLIPLKRAVQGTATMLNPLVGSPASPEPFRPNVFVGHSFAKRDKSVVDCVVDTLTAVGLSVLTGEKPESDKVSEKVKRRIEAQHIFVGLFTRGDRLEKKDVWTTSAWVIDEKAYAYSKGKRLVLLKEDGVGSIGGLHGDLEYIDFSRNRLDYLVRRIIQLFDVRTTALR